MILKGAVNKWSSRPRSSLGPLRSSPGFNLDKAVIIKREFDIGYWTLNSGGMNYISSPNRGVRRTIAEKSARRIEAQ
jgi:hypothetical protein